MKKIVFVVLCFLFISQTQNAQTFEFKADKIEIPYERFVLPNGLTLLVHEDHKAPIAAVNVWYHVGSKNEKPDAVNWFMVGDRAKIASKLDELGFDNIIEIDADGNPIEPTVKDPEIEIKN